MKPSPPPRRSLLPKELDDIDAGWGEEHPTVPIKKPSMMPKAATRSDDAEDGDRETTIPEEPPDQFARRVMAGESRDILFQGEIPTAPGIDEDFFDRPTSVGKRGGTNPSQIPTAPPPAGFSTERIQTVPRSPSLDNLFALADQIEPPPPSESSLVERLRRSVTPIARFDREVPPPPNEERQAETKRPGRSLTPVESMRPDEVRDMKERFALGDFSGALAIAEGLLSKTPGHSDARPLAEKCREVLLDMYGSRVGDFAQPVRVLMSHDQIRWLSLDHRSGFLLSMVDGMSTVDELLDISGMPRLDALRILAGLVDQKVVGIGGR